MFLCAIKKSKAELGSQASENLRDEKKRVYLVDAHVQKLKVPLCNGRVIV